jgi:hypothetical protein
MKQADARTGGERIFPVTVLEPGKWWRHGTRSANKVDHNDVREEIKFEN